MPGKTVGKTKMWRAVPRTHADKRHPLYGKPTLRQQTHWLRDVLGNGVNRVLNSLLQVVPKYEIVKGQRHVTGMCGVVA